MLLNQCWKHEVATVQVAVPSPSSLFTLHGGHQLKKTQQVVPTKYCLLCVTTPPDFPILATLGCCLVLGQSLLAPHSTHQARLALVPVFFDGFLLPWFFSVWLLCPVCLGVKLILWGQNPPWLIQKLHHPYTFLCLLLEWENRVLSRHNYCI